MTIKQHRHEAQEAKSSVEPQARALDRSDRRILRLLQQDGRCSISRLAKEVHLSVTPTLERVRKLESAGYIDGYFARLNATRLGLGLLAYVEVSLDRPARDAFKRFRSSMLAYDTWWQAASTIC